MELMKITLTYADLMTIATQHGFNLDLDTCIKADDMLSVVFDTLTSPSARLNVNAFATEFYSSLCEAVLSDTIILEGNDLRDNDVLKAAVKVELDAIADVTIDAMIDSIHTEIGSETFADALNRKINMLRAALVAEFGLDDSISNIIEVLDGVRIDFYCDQTWNVL